MTSSLVGISLKMYMSASQTKSWVAALSAEVGVRAEAGNVEVFVLPSFPLLESTSALLRDSAVRWGAQDLAADSGGAQTGEIHGAVLRELGCTYVEVGHAERRRMFGESDAMVVDKMRQAFANDLMPVLCIGEITRETAYEPVWAIGAAKPADPEPVRDVCSTLRAYTANRSGRTRILYGGSAGPGTFDALDGSADGLFLGRFAHDVANVVAVLEEIDLHGQRASCE